MDIDLAYKRTLPILSTRMVEVLVNKVLNASNESSMMRSSAQIAQSGGV